jgi:restriction system protein
MNLWMVRAGSLGEQEAECLANNIATISWNEMPDLSRFKSKAELQLEFDKHYQEKTAVGRGLKTAQIYRFSHDILKGDLIILPSKFAPEIHIGRVTGSYRFKQISPEIIHTVPVKWEKTISRSEFDEDLLYSFGSLLTVSQITRNNAPQRVEAMLTGSKYAKNSLAGEEGENENDSPALIDSEELAYTRIEQFIQRNFGEHKLEELIREILRAEGYNTSHVKEIGNVRNTKLKGADGGVDILASKGSLGFEKPTICVQVKSGKSELSATALRELGGVMAAFKAEFGLLVSWGGFSQTLIKEGREKYFTIRLWDSANIINSVFSNYNKFSSEFQSRLPLKQVWILDQEEKRELV